MRRVCVFCGSSSGRLPAYAEAAGAFGAAVASRGLGLVYGGGRVGLMGALADGALSAGGEPPGGRTFGLWTPDEKNRISHRARAARRMAPRLAELGF